LTLLQGTAKITLLSSVSVIIYNFFEVEMRKLFFALVLAVLGLIFSGCATLPNGFVKDPIPGRASYERKARISRTVEIQRQQFWNDWDRFWLLERPSRLNELRQR